MERLTAFQLFTILSLGLSLQVPVQISLTVAETGVDLTLTCNVSGRDPGSFYWYKMNYGHRIERIASGTYRGVKVEEKNITRFSIRQDADVYFLTIRNVRQSDEGTFFCQAGITVDMDVVQSTMLIVKDLSTAHLRQSPVEASVEVGGSLTLQCSLVSMCRETGDQCPGKERVHWFKAGPASHPGLIYNVSLHQQKNRTCFYSLSKTIRDQSEAGNYHCAVVACGEILIGNGTNVSINARQELKLVIVFGTLLIISVVLHFSLIITRKRKTDCGCRDDDETTEDQRTNVDGEEEDIQYAALDFSSRKSKRGKKRKDECIYSNTRNYQ